MTEHPQGKDELGEWRLLRDALVPPILGTLRRPLAILYFLGGVVILGGLGTWIPLVNHILSSTSLPQTESLRASGVTYLVSVFSTVIFDTVTKGMSDPNPGRTAVLTMISLLMIVCVLVGHLAGPNIAVGLSATYGIVIPAVIAWVLWIIANGDDSRFSARSDPKAAFPKGDLAGNVDGFRTK